MKFVTVDVFNSPIEAHLAKSRLEDIGIKCFIIDEHTIGMNLLFNQLLGGVKLKVLEQNYGEAREVLSELDERRWLDDKNQNVKCPHCHSMNINSDYKSIRGTSGFFAFLISIFFLAYPLYFEHRYFCKECGKEFKKKNSDNS